MQSELTWRGMMLALFVTGVSRQASDTARRVTRAIFWLTSATIADDAAGRCGERRPSLRFPSTAANQKNHDGHSANASTTVAMVRSISRSDVNQLHTETRMTRMPRHVAPP